MSKQLPYLGEVIGLAVMLLMVVALVAAQADASVRAGMTPAGQQPGIVLDAVEAAPDTRLRAVIDLDALTIAIEASAKITPRGSLLRGN